MTDVHGEISWFVYVVRLQDDFSQADRDRILEHLQQQGVGCNNYFSPIHLQPFYRRQFGFARGDFPVTERVAERTIALPFYNNLGEPEMRHVYSALRSALSRKTRPQVMVASGGPEVNS